MARLVELSPRQQQVILLAAQGLTIFAIAYQLELSPRTVEYHLSQARNRLGAQNTTHAVALYYTKGVESHG